MMINSIPIKLSISRLLFDYYFWCCLLTLHLCSFHLAITSKVHSTTSNAAKSAFIPDDGNNTSVEYVQSNVTSELQDQQVVYPVGVGGVKKRLIRRHANDVINNGGGGDDDVDNTVERRQYVFDAFARRFQIHVTKDDAFLAPNLSIRYAAKNDTWLEELPPWKRHCFYAGRLADDDVNSRVVLNVCDGLSGHIVTEDATYFIQPLIKNSTHNSSSPTEMPPSLPAHVITRKPIRDKEIQHCATQDFSVSDSDGDDNFYDYVERENRSRGKRSISHDLHIEVMVTADSTMKLYHGDDLHDYILTLMSTVAQIFRDPSIGNAISVSVVKIVITEAEEDRDFVSTSASRTLRSFCKWQSAQNYHDDAHYLHYDMAILLTREDICRSPKKCDTLGLADLGTMCDTYNSCAIVEDNGLSTAFTIAHEMGHVLNLPHDDDVRCRNFSAENNLKVMARFVDLNTNPWTWSACSAHYVTEFLDTDSVSCLRDRPTTNRLAWKALKNELPGQIFSADKQCALLYGDGSSICPYMPSCRRLWCLRTDNKGCRTHHMPWADGTLCSDSSWCFHGVCKRKETLVFRPVDGQWSKWSEDGPCSRTCGGGIKRSVRYCNNPKPEHGGKYCIGERVRYKSCNTEDCPLGSTDFREAQCSAFNNYHFSLLGLSPNIRWVPKYSGISPKHRCKLYCRVSTSSDYYVLRDKVVDGTTCGLDTYDICVNGHCLPAGCDHKLYSKVKLDDCNVCGGNNTTCHRVAGYYNKVQYGYNRVVTIPAGSINVDIKQFGHEDHKEDDNYLALTSDENEYILNGDYTVTTSKKKFEYGGTVFEYTGSNAVVERINCSRPLQRDLFVEVLSVGKLLPPEIHYIYNTPLFDISSSKYAYELDDSWSECSHFCNGMQNRLPVCVIKSSHRRAPDEKCLKLSKLNEATRSCNDHCHLTWKVTNRSECLTDLGCGSGFMRQTVRCAQHISDGDQHELADSYCTHLPEEKPQAEIPCNQECLSAYWEYGSWSECSRSCDGGIKTRKAYCRGDDGHFLSDEYCASQAQDVVRECGQEECPKWKVGEWTFCSQKCNGERQRPYWCEIQNVTLSEAYCVNQEVPLHVEPCSDKTCFVWDYGKWSMCSVTCGNGVARRLVRCRTDEGRLVNDSNCDQATRPADSLFCSTSVNCPNTITTDSSEDNNVMPQETTPPTPMHDVQPLKPPDHSSGRYLTWKIGHWGKCSATCGSGIRSRRVTCLDGESGFDVDDLECLGIFPKPVSEEHCQGSLCYGWKTGEWSMCTKTCGGGVMTRTVVCKDDNGYEKVLNSREDCDGIERPLSVATCNEDQCPTWVVGEWSECSKTCGTGMQERSVHCGAIKGESDGLDTDCTLSSKPATTQECNAMNCPLGNVSPSLGIISSLVPNKNRWKTGPWSSCPVSCGNGQQKRQVICLDQHDSIMPSDMCKSPAPLNIQDCKVPSCPEWVFLEDWSTCSQTCGGGSQWRVAICVQDGHKVKSELCGKGETAPVEQRACHLDKCLSTGHWKTHSWQPCNRNCMKHRRVVCVDHRERTLSDKFCSSAKPRTWRRCKKCYRPFRWVPGPWTDCSSTCGPGYRGRAVSCHRVNRFGWVYPTPLADQKSCNASERPSSVQKCNLGDCGALYHWVALKWQPCSVTCGRGIQKRSIRCYDRQRNKVHRRKCPSILKPRKERKCRMRPCSNLSCHDVQRHHGKKEQEYMMYVRGKTVSIYCADMNTSNPKEYITVSSSDRENFSEIYEKRLIMNNTCPNEGKRLANCECVNVGPMAGLTVFHKIRVNITSLRVIVDDFRFTKQVHGSQISYGKAGDCYSLQNCPQGRFSVDLSNTGFVVDESTSWIAYGTKPYRRITAIPSRQKINGLCGGYCGVCMPDPSNGLLLDIKQPP